MCYRWGTKLLESILSANLGIKSLSLDQDITRIVFNDSVCNSHFIYINLCTILFQAHNNLKLEFESLSESYDRLHHKSQEIIHTLQNERDEKIIECEELKPQVHVVLTCIIHTAFKKTFRERGDEIGISEC